ncbi:hypothetical protein [Tropicimonas isoalkanivorans]|uniref:hypothetical protein n=1 Tax=Tropicimonas isoalkanivorans TaxID=441112 RepID=UPI001FE18270|nr:hypothetical protein [Tropicimonas isoalkanivorans]
MAVGRAFLDDPNWARHAAADLGIDGHGLWPKEAGWWLDVRARTLTSLAEEGADPMHPSSKLP